MSDAIELIVEAWMYLEDDGLQNLTPEQARKFLETNGYSKEQAQRVVKRIRRHHATS